MNKITFNRTVNGVLTEFEACVTAENDNVLSIKEMYENEENSWLKIEKKGVPIFYRYNGLVFKHASAPKSVSIFYDIHSLVPDLTEPTRNGVTTDVRQLWNDPLLIKFFESMSYTTQQEAKRSINGILEREFGALPIFDPIGNQDAIINEEDMAIRVAEFQTLLNS